MKDKRFNKIMTILIVTILLSTVFFSFYMHYIAKTIYEIESKLKVLELREESNGRPTAGVTNDLLTNTDNITIVENNTPIVKLSEGSNNDSNNVDNKNINEEIKVNPEASEGLQNEYEELEESEPEFIEVESTAYYNKYNRKCADGTTHYYGVLAGKIEWLGKEVELYNSNKEYIGDFTFHDTGYGQSTGYGNSKVLEGKSLGTIETGQCIDIFMSTYEQCIDYGRRKVYIVFKDE